MADPTDSADDVYNDPDNILTGSDKVEGGTELPEFQKRQLSQTPFLPEQVGDDRGVIDEIDPDTQLSEGEDPDHPAEADPDADRLSGAIPPEERDGTEKV